MAAQAQGRWWTHVCVEWRTVHASRSVVGCGAALSALDGHQAAKGQCNCAGVVLVPTGALPLKLMRRSERAIIERALSAPAPFTRLIAVVSTGIINSIPRIDLTSILSLFLILTQCGP
jgi:hypothetical protein